MRNLIVTLSVGCLLLSASCSPKATDQFTPTKIEKTGALDDNGDDFQASKVDLLFIIDNSGSMQSHQTNLSKNVTAFTKAFTAGVGLDYHIGVITSDDGPCTPCAGQLKGNPKFVTSRTPNVNTELEKNMLVGTNSMHNELFFDPIVHAFEPGMLKNWNKDFFRPDAALVIIFITDADDQSRTYDMNSTYNILLNLKGGDKSKLLAYGVLIPVGINPPAGCSRDDAGPPRKIEGFLGMFQNAGKNIMNMCDANYGTKLADLANDIAKRVSNVILLNRLPVVESIRVEYGTLTVPMDRVKGWSYDLEKNAIVIGEGFDWNVQPWGTPFKVYYQAIPVN
jgi:hypothetical protein